MVGKIGDDLRMDYTAQGATVGIEQLPAPSHVYLSGATERLVAGYFQLRAMGKTDLNGLTEALPSAKVSRPNELPPWRVHRRVMPVSV